jgi:hypothetical protein
VPIRTVVQQVLQTWYVKQDYTALIQFIAKDNAFSFPPIREEMHVASTPSQWGKLFHEAFTDRSEHFGQLREAIGFSVDNSSDARSMRFLNANQLGNVEDPFGIVSPDSVPPGMFFPLIDVSPKQRARFDPRAEYLDHLNRDYKGHLFVVLYATKGAGLLKETAVLYWILENDNWRLAAFQGTD